MNDNKILEEQLENLLNESNAEFIVALLHKDSEDVSVAVRTGDNGAFLVQSLLCALVDMLKQCGCDSLKAHLKMELMVRQAIEFIYKEERTNGH